MRIGQVIMIFEDPITKRIEEGKAKLLNLVEQESQYDEFHNKLEYWEVKFLSDDFITCRWI